MAISHLYGFPAIGRAGLGNALFPWSRCYLWCKDQQVPMIGPFWTQFRLGPYLRREMDKRQYQKLFSHHGYVSGWWRLICLATSIKIEEEQRDDALISVRGHRPAVVVFRGLNTYFEPLLDRHADLRAALWRITEPEYLSANLPFTKFVGIHVRLGDFSKPNARSDPRRGHNGARLPLDWFVDVLTTLRAALGYDVDALICSDGALEELNELLSMPRTMLYRGGSAITDLLALAEASVLIASGSTFSMWASFLGQVPCVWFPSQRKQFLLEAGGQNLEPELDYGEHLTANFIDAVAQRLVA